MTGVNINIPNVHRCDAIKQKVYMKNAESNKNDSVVNTNFEIISFEIFDLFGSLHHTVNLKSGGVTFIHGPNGSGKTTALLLFERFLALKFSEMKSIFFSKIEVKFSDGFTLLAERVIAPKKAKDNSQNYLFEDENSEGDIYEIKVSLKQGRSIVEKPISVADNVEVFTLKQQVLTRSSTVERLAPGLLDRVGPRAWKLSTTGDVLGINEVANFLAEHSLRSSLPTWVIDRVKNIKLGVIRAQRLFELNNVPDSAEGTQEVKQIVSVFSQDVKNKIKQKIAQSALQFQKKEKTFPHRILAGEVKAETESILRKNYIDLQERVRTLESVGLQESSDSLVLPKIKLNPTHKRVLTLYLADINEKLDVFNDIFGQISLMSELLSNKLRRKKFSINKIDGFKLTSNSGVLTSLKPTDLSSGEQHQLVMLYQLIFSDAPNQLYLIDEPEISLHVEWQRQFSDDLRRIAESRGHQFIIATHSPQIINGRLDLANALDGGIQGE